jgi:hypothetical protein
MKTDGTLSDSGALLFGSMKDIVYIRHDVNSSQDPKIVKIRAKFGPCAYAVYWCALESIRNEDSITLALEDTDVIA